MLIALYVASSVPQQQKVVVRVPTMTDDKIKQKAIEAVADIYGNILHLWLTVFLFFFSSLLDDGLFCC